MTTVIEFLSGAPEFRKQYLQIDAEIWTQALARCLFLGKEVWNNEPTEVILVIRWASRKQWKSISELLDAIEQQFVQLGNTYQIVEVSEYQVEFPPK